MEESGIDDDDEVVLPRFLVKRERKKSASNGLRMEAFCIRYIPPLASSSCLCGVEYLELTNYINYTFDYY